MSNHRRIWSVAEKLEALQTLEKEGLTKTIRQLDISSTTLYKWQKQFEESGETGLTQKNSQKRDLVHEKLLKENRELILYTTINL